MHVGSSRQPTYSPMIAALSNSGYSRTPKAIPPADLARPPTLPPRADPKSEEARIFGPFSIRRELNIRWRFFSSNLKKLLPPIQVPPPIATDLLSVESRSSTSQNCRLPDETKIIVMESLNRLSKARSFIDHQGGPPSSRFLRRRHQELLARIPILTPLPSKPSPSLGGMVSTKRYDVSLSLSARAQAIDGQASKLPLPSISAISWLRGH